MASRSLGSATVWAVFALLACDPAAGQNLDAGKSPAQIFSQTCAVCHKSARGLLKTTSPGSLPSFLRQHYTTSAEMAGTLSAYLVSNGAANQRLGGEGLTKQGREARSGGAAERPDQPQPDAPRASRRGRPDIEQAARPDADGASPETPRAPRKRQGRPDPAAAPAVEGQTPQQASLPPDGQSGRQKLGRKGKAGRDAAKPVPPVTPPEPSPAAAAPEPVVARPEIAPETPKPAGDDVAARPDAGSAPPASIRPDPVPAVTPAPAAGESDAAPDLRPAEPRGPVVIEPPPPSMVVTTPSSPPDPPISQ